jgi:hypothetical protein
VLVRRRAQPKLLEDRRDVLVDPGVGDGERLRLQRRQQALEPGVRQIVLGDERDRARDTDVVVGRRGRIP